MARIHSQSFVIRMKFQLGRPSFIPGEIDLNLLVIKLMRFFRSASLSARRKKIVAQQIGRLWGCKMNEATHNINSI